MRLASYRNGLALIGSLALGSLLGGCPEKSLPVEKPTVEPERAEPDDEGKTADHQKAAAPAATPAAAPADDRKPDEDKDKDKGGW